jgi:hypothetical protein
MNEESKLIELFKKYPGIAARIRRSFAYHYDQIQREIEAEDENIHFKSIQDIEDYFEIVHIQTQELTSIGFKTAILDL